MPSRLLLAVALLTLTACTPAPAPTPPPQPTPRWTLEEQTAVTAATTQYAKSRAAYAAALQHPTTATRATLEAAGMSGSWLDSAVEHADYFRTHKIRRTGASKILSTDPLWVSLSDPTPAVVLKTCLDDSPVTEHDPAEKTPFTTTRHRLVEARLLHLPTGWSLTAESPSPDTAQPPPPGHPTC
ncbi:hypothetical protein GCM10009745_40730 [Kribbella yunnanensis]|uniref:Secreted protein/lipoprotein n=1 Tax=Kribbella yunnanensis TaxID=190194 RepID=A0ABN2HPH0_9ACTN